MKKPSPQVNTKVYFNNNAMSYEEAREQEEWRDSVGNETNATVVNDTWCEVELPKGKKVVTSKWVFTIKYLENGKVERRKTRLVARGYTHTYGEDYIDTFAHVAKLHTIRIVLSLAVNLQLDLLKINVKNAFLRGELELKMKYICTLHLTLNIL